MSLVHAAARLLLSLMPVFICVPAIWSSAVLLIRPMRGGVLRNPRLVGIVIALACALYLFLVTTREAGHLAELAQLLSLLVVPGVAALFAAVTDHAYRTHFDALFFLPHRAEKLRWSPYVSIGIAAIAVSGTIGAQHLHPCGALDIIIQLSGCRAAVSIGSEQFLPELAIAPGARMAVVDATPYKGPMQIEIIPLGESQRSTRMRPLERSDRQYVSEVISAASLDRIAVRTYDGECYIWDTQSGALVQAIEPTDESHKVHHVALAPSGGVAAIARRDGYVALLREQPPGEELIMRSVSAAQLAFSNDGTYLAISGSDQTVIWNLTAGAIVKRLAASGEPIWSPDNATLMVISSWGVVLAEIGAGEPITRSLDGGESRGAFASDGTPLIAQLSWRNGRQLSDLTIRDLRTDTLLLSITLGDPSAWGVDGESRTLYLYDRDLMVSRNSLLLYNIPAAAPAP